MLIPIFDPTYTIRGTFIYGVYSKVVYIRGVFCYLGHTFGIIRYQIDQNYSLADMHTSKYYAKVCRKIYLFEKNIPSLKALSNDSYLLLMKLTLWTSLYWTPLVLRYGVRYREVSAIKRSICHTGLTLLVYEVTSIRCLRSLLTLKSFIHTSVWLNIK